MAISFRSSSFGMAKEIKAKILSITVEQELDVEGPRLRCLPVEGVAVPEPVAPQVLAHHRTLVLGQSSRGRQVKLLAIARPNVWKKTSFDPIFTVAECLVSTG